MSWESLITFAKNNPGGAIFVAIVVLAGGMILVQRLRVGAWYLIVCVIAGLVAFATQNSIYFFVFMLGMLTAAAEIIGKFRDEPLKALSTTQGFWYHVFNGLVAIFALYIVLLYGVPNTTPLDRLKVVVTAGFGSMLLMRSKLFNIKVGDEDISFGPDQIVKVYFRFMEEAIDRVRASARIDVVKEIMDNLDFDHVSTYTQTMLDSAQTLSKADADKLKEAIIAIGNGAAEPQLKSYRLGFLILNEMGEDFLYRLFGQRSTDWLIRAPVPQARQDGLFERLSFGTSRGESVRYFAYGSSMSPVDFGQLMGWQETELGKFIEVTTPKRAILKGYRLEFNRPSKHDPQREGRANIVPDPNGQVEGVLYRLSRTGFEFLDKHQTGYRREIVRVLEDGREVDALAFIAEESREGLVPSRSYLERLLLGAQQWKLSPEYQERLKGTATTEEEPKTRSTAA